MRDFVCRSSLRALVGLGLVLSVFAALPATGQSTSQASSYMPLIARARLAPAPVFGMVMTTMTPERGFADVVAAGATWIRSDNNLLWREVEPVEGAGYHWDGPGTQLLEQELIRASQANMKAILLVRGSPRWATAPYKVDCAPINPAKYQRFAAFVAAAVERYSKPPYNAVYWQIGNETDAYIASADAGYGCWGVKSDPYYGGRAYGNMLKVVYPAIKRANPAIQVLHGSLLLDRPYEPGTNVGLSARFLEGVLLAGAAESFDILPYNSYFWDLERADWKLPYIQNMLRSYNVPPKPMIITETGLLCEPSQNLPPKPPCPELQSYAVGRYYTRALANNLLGSLWYIYDGDGFHHTALIDPHDITQYRPAYRAYQYAASVLGDAAYLGPLKDPPAGVEGYRFTRPAGMLTVLWSSKTQPVAVPVARAAAVACTSWDGAPLLCSNTSDVVNLSAGLGPIYVQEQDKR